MLLATPRRWITWLLLGAVELLFLLGGTTLAGALPAPYAVVFLTLLGCLALGSFVGHSILLWQWRRHIATAPDADRAGADTL